MAVLSIQMESAALERKVSIQAIIPLESSPENYHFPALYLLHGMSGDGSDWIWGSNIVQLAKDYQIAIFMPTCENGFYVNHPNGDRYSTFISEELISFTRSMFPLNSSRDSTFIAGLSMGGFGAIVNGLRYPETFGYIAGLSSAFVKDRIIQSSYHDAQRVNNRYYYESMFGDLSKFKGGEYDYEALIIRSKKNKIEIPHIYLSCGKSDFLIEHNRAFHLFLKNLEIQHVYQEADGEHNWQYWSEHIVDILKWLPLQK